MTRREYGQFCGLSRALEIVGERWALLIVRDLLVGPKRLDDMHKGLPRMPQDILAARLKELERSGIVRRHGPSPSNGSDSDELGEPDGSTVFELTESGSELEDAVLKLALWGTRLLDKPRPKDIVTPDSLVMALRTTFRPEAAVGVRVSYELRFGPEMIIHARIDDGAIEAAEGPLPDADLVIEPGPMLKALMAREVTPAKVLEDGSVSLTGDPNLLNRFVDLFYIPPAPAARQS
ncbi:MAG TPA: transcriptional regulator [Micromonosporaceae bacterium]|nr:transcriptional regulator [Micromonosporaceae bacterium]